MFPKIRNARLIMIILWADHLPTSEKESQHEDSFDNANLNVSVLLLFTLSNGSRFLIGMVRGMNLFHFFLQAG